MEPLFVAAHDFYSHHGEQVVVYLTKGILAIADIVGEKMQTVSRIVRLLARYCTHITYEYVLET